MERVLEPELMDTLEDASEYDEMDNRAENAAFVERLVGLDAHGRVLDIGTGPGHIPLLVCDRLPDAHVIAIDMADHMLEIANRHLARSPHGKRVEFRRGDAKKLDFADQSFDTVFSNTVMHHIPDPRLALAEARRVLKSDGVLLIRDLYRRESAEQVRELVALHASDATAYQRQLFQDSLHAALAPYELRAFADELGLERAELLIDTDRHMSLQIPVGG